MVQWIGLGPPVRFAMPVDTKSICIHCTGILKFFLWIIYSLPWCFLASLLRIFLVELVCNVVHRDQTPSMSKKLGNLMISTSQSCRIHKKFPYDQPRPFLACSGNLITCLISQVTKPEHDLLPFAGTMKGNVGQNHGPSQQIPPLFPDCLVHPSDCFSHVSGWKP
jgi:hypothetical protein